MGVGGVLLRVSWVKEEGAKAEERTKGEEQN